MSVFTPVTKEEARTFLAEYALGDVESIFGIAAGVENSNFFLTTTTGEYVLTLFEKQSIEDLPFYLHLMEYLGENEFNCPRPQIRFASNHRKELFGILHGKPAAIVTRLAGSPRLEPTPGDCTAVGRLLAQMHEIGVDFDMGMTNWRGRAWREAFAAEAAPKLSAAQNELIAGENGYQAGIDDESIPKGIIHGDLFRDNILWDDEGVPGVIDFYFACDDLLLYDLAITVNDWCTHSDATLDSARADMLIAGYREVRDFEENENALWPAMLRRAALRTWLGRIGYSYFPQDGHITHVKDHAFSEKLLRYHILNAQYHSLC
jgi:homoserine kinase type II